MLSGNTAFAGAENHGAEDLSRVGPEFMLTAYSKSRLRDAISPGVVRKICLADLAESGDDTAQLEEDIRGLNERIHKKGSECEEHSKYRGIGFWCGPLGGAVSLSIHGPRLF